MSMTMGDIRIVIAAFCMNAFTLGPMRSLGPLFLSFEIALNATAGQASLVSALMYGTMFLGGPLASFLANTFGYRKTTLVGSILASVGAIACSFSKAMISIHICSSIVGFGCCLTAIPRMAIIGNHFEEKRSFVNNIVTMGSALISIPLSPFVQLWINEYSWQGAILLLGALILNSLPSGLMLTTNVPRDLKKSTPLHLELLKSFPFCSYIAACGCNIAAGLCVSIYLVRFAQSRGIDDYLAAILPSVVSFVDLTLRPVSGYVTSLSHIGSFRIQRIHIFLGILVIQSIVALSFTFCWTYEALIVTSIIYAVISGCRGALSLTLTADLFGGRKLVSALGWRYLSMGLFSITVPPLMGNIVETNGSFAVPFYAGAALYLMSASLVLLVKVTEERMKEHKTGNDEKEETNSPLESVKPNG